MVTGRDLKAAIESADDKDESLSIPAPRSSTEITADAQLVLDAAIESVNSLLNTMRLSREISRARRGLQAQGRLSHSEVDVLRSAIILSGAGLDATLKELTRAGLQQAIERDEKAGQRFEQFTEAHLADSSNLARAIASVTDTRELLVEMYTAELVGSSLQSVSQIEMICTALGLTNSDFRRTLADNAVLQDMFQARNRIIHEFDLTPDEYHSRRYHSIENAKVLSREALVTAQLIVDELAASEQ